MKVKRGVKEMKVKRGVKEMKVKRIFAALVATVMAFTMSIAVMAEEPINGFVQEAEYEPEMIYIEEVLDTGADVKTVTGQNLTYDFSGDNNVLRSNSTDPMYPNSWIYYKVKCSKYTSVSAAKIRANLRYNAGGTLTFYSLTKAEWDNALSKKDSGNTATITDNLIVNPVNNANSVLLDGVRAAASGKSYHLVTATGSAWQDTTTDGTNENYAISSTGGNLQEYINQDASDGEIYVAVCYLLANTAADGKDRKCQLNNVIANSDYRPLFTITGEIDLSDSELKLVSQKTDIVKITDVGLTDSHYPTENKANYAIGSAQANAISNSSALVSDSTATNYWLKRLYYRADMSEYSGKNIISIKLHLSANRRKSGGKLYMYKVTSDWDVDTICFNNAPAFDATTKALTSGDATTYYHSENDVTSFYDSKNDFVSVMIDGVCGSTSNIVENLYQTVAVNAQNVTDDYFAPYFEITYTDDITPTTNLGDDYTFLVTPSNSAGKAFLATAIYDSSNSLIKVVAGIKEIKDGVMSIDMDLTNVNKEDIKKIKGFFWKTDKITNWSPSVAVTFDN